MVKKKVKKKAKKKASKRPLKAKAWRLFSEYIRRKYSDENGNCECVTCGKIDHWSELQAGHSVSGRTNSVLFVEDIVHPQCVRCNIFMGGNYERYTLFMIDMYGRAKYEELLDLKNVSVKISVTDLEEICVKYKSLIDQLKARASSGS